MKNILALIAFLCSVAVFSQNEYQGQLLEKAFENKSKEYLHDFFENWQNEIPTINDEEFISLNDTLQQAYNAFSVFYKPCIIDSTGNYKWGTLYYASSEYFLVQSSIQVYFTDKIYYSDEEAEAYTIERVNNVLSNEETKEKWLRRNKSGNLITSTLEHFGPGSYYWMEHIKENKIIKYDLKNFRPVIAYKGGRAVYLTKEYERLFNIFFSNKPFDTSEKINDNLYIGKQSKKKRKFVEKYIKTSDCCMINNCWIFKSYPVAKSLIFDKDMKYAMFEYRMFCHGGYVILKNNNGHWEFFAQKTISVS